MPLPFLDTNVLIRHITGDHEEFSPRATALISRIEHDGLRVQTSETVIFETVFTLYRSYKLTKKSIREDLRLLLSLRGITLPNRETVLRALDHFADRNMSFGDAYHAALMERLGLTEIYSFDGDFRRVPGIIKLEP